MRMVKVELLVLAFSLALWTGHSSGAKMQYQIQNGPCSYTFLLPEQDNCQSQSSGYNYPVQRDGPVDQDESTQRLEQLEIIMENNTQWLLKVINHTTRLERQLLENSLSTTKLEKQLIVQSNEINKLSDKNSFLEKKVEEIEKHRQGELMVFKEEKEQLQTLIRKQTAIICELEQQLLKVSSNNSVLQRQQQKLLDTVNSLIESISGGAAPMTKSAMMQDNPTTFMDCAAVFKSGNTQSGVYTLTLPNTTVEVKAFCDMETEGGGWTVLQKRFDGHVDFHRTWQEYKKGFGEPSGEFWLGNEFISRLSRQKSYKLRIQLSDWDGNSGFSQYDQFSVEDEAQNYRIHLKGYSGTAGKTSSIGQPGSDFSTKDADNDKCVCKCSQLSSGGWWFDACGPSNLNGMYYQRGQNSNRFNGIKWYYWKGSGYSLKSTTMMMRPADFKRSL